MLMHISVERRASQFEFPDTPKKNERFRTEESRLEANKFRSMVVIARSMFVQMPATIENR